MKSITGKQLASILERDGWILLRINGSHHIYAKAGIDAPISIPIHGNQPLKRGLLRHFLRIAALDDRKL